ncbi:MAG: type II CRISPR RNA-guided endonuclease Cas9 [Proteobacteria bacterium]|nr:type II CRISPR RNA-guided endonuclease Cas9 [Pseudomonadota bacterium]
MEKFDFYYLGLDIGTNSVGWAVTDESYRIMRYKGQDMWGVHLFDEAQTAAERRGFRTARRRRERVRNRIIWLRTLMRDEIDAVDAEFFQRLDEATLHREDRSTNANGNHSQYTLFDDPDFCDVTYHTKYPTIYHLRHDLMQPWEYKYDIRLLYLAIAHILKSRGNFLYQGASFETGNAFEQIYEALELTATDCGIFLPKANHGEIKALLIQKGIKRKKDGLIQLFQAKGNKPLTELIALLVGGKPKVNDLFATDENEKDYKSLFDDDDSLKNFSLEKPDFEEKVLPALENILDDMQYQLMVVAKKLYDWTVLCQILGEHKTLSESMIAQYNTHHVQVAQLKTLVKKYCPEQYKPFFKDDKQKDNYIAWIGKGQFKSNSSQCSQEDFEKSLGKLLKSIPNGTEKQQILDEIEAHAFLPKLRTGNNGVIPYQLHLNELRIILKNASTYYPFLSKADTDSEFTVAQKIEKILTFRIPYYVGPLCDKDLAEKDPQHGHAWIVRHYGFEHTPIRPWNFDKVVDLDACAEAFIRRMTNKCTYLPMCDTIPKESLLYSEYMFLNQLNNLKIAGNPIDRDSKKQVLALCKKQRSVSHKDIAKLLSIGRDELSGFDDDLKLSLKSYHDFKAILGADALECDNVREFVESCIQACTIFNESTDNLLKNRIQRSAEALGMNLTDQQIHKIAGLHYKDWGNFSREFLTQISGYSQSHGECYSIIQALREETDNLMQLLSSRKYTFSEEIRQFNDAHRKASQNFTYNALVKPLHCSPAVKRSIWRTLVIVKDIVRVTGHTPARIFVEMARDDANKKQAQKGKRTTSRKDQLLEKFRQFKKDPDVHAELLEALQNKVSDDDLRRSKDKLYLYFSQNGRCMYSGEPIDLDRLMGDKANNIWDIDHIYPQSKVMDNSLDNRVLVRKDLNHRKQDKLPIPSGVVTNIAKQHWKWLLKHDLISQEKYDRLTRNYELSADELAGFIARQLVETRQTTKLVCEILREAFESHNTQIIYSHAGRVSAFRSEHINPERGEFEMVKCRDINDFHHAKDAYLNIVVGNIFHTRFTQNPADIFKTGEHINVQYYTENHTGLLQNRICRFDPRLKREIRAWIPGESIKIVRKNVGGTRILFTRQEYEVKGGFYDQQILKAKYCQKAKIPIKSKTKCFHDYTRYGGYDNDKGAYFILVEYTDKKKRIRAFRHVPVRLANAIRRDPNRLLEYCKASEPFGLNLKNPKILIDKVLFNARFIFDGFPFTINGRTGTSFLIRHCAQLVLSGEQTWYLKRVLESVEKKQLSPEVTVEKNIELYEAFLNKHKNAIYKLRPAAQLKTLENGFGLFKSLELSEQCEALKNILTLFTCSTGGVTDLTLISGSKNAGSMTESMNLENCNTAYIEHPSPTGLTCTRVDLKALQ